MGTLSGKSDTINTGIVERVPEGGSVANCGANSGQ